MFAIYFSTIVYKQMREQMKTVVNDGNKLCMWYVCCSQENLFICLHEKYITMYSVKIRILIFSGPALKRQAKVMLFSMQ